MPDAADPYVIPELTRGLRHFALPSALGSDHARFFAPLLTARRLAHEAVLWTGRAAAFEPTRLRGAWEEMLSALAAERFPVPGGDRRALVAELQESTAAVSAALDALGPATDAVRRASDEAARAVAWEHWIAVLRTLFSAADAGWGAVLPILADSRGAAGRRWRGLLRGGASPAADD
jgi:hypothetical protein